MLRQVFPRPDAISSGKMPIISEPIYRSEDFITRYGNWRESEKVQMINNWIHESRKEGYTKKDNFIDIGYYRDRGIEGLIIRNISGLDLDDYRFFLDYLKEKTLVLNYKLYHGITESREEQGKVRTKEEYYLKPTLGNLKYPLNQEFGNITFELNLLNDQPDFLKIVTTTYTGYNYQEPDPFELFLEHLFSEN